MTVRGDTTIHVYILSNPWEINHMDGQIPET